MTTLIQIGEHLPCPAPAGKEDENATRSLTTRRRLNGSDVWQFRWSERNPQGGRAYRKRVIGTIEQYPNLEAARSAVHSLITEVNWVNSRATSVVMTVAQLCAHFEQRELTLSNTWCS